MLIQQLQQPITDLAQENEHNHAENNKKVKTKMS
jgi:hypothetical protein